MCVLYARAIHFYVPRALIGLRGVRRYDNKWVDLDLTQQLRTARRDAWKKMRDLFTWGCARVDVRVCVLIGMLASLLWIDLMWKVKMTNKILPWNANQPFTVQLLQMNSSKTFCYNPMYSVYWRKVICQTKWIYFENHFSVLTWTLSFSKHCYSFPLFLWIELSAFDRRLSDFLLTWTL